MTRWRRRFARWRGGAAAMLTSSGQAANFFALFNICNAGDHIVASSAIYGGTFNLINVTMRKMGIECTFVSPDCTPEELGRRVPAEHQGRVRRVDLEPGADRARLRQVRLRPRMTTACRSSWTNTFPTPINCRPVRVRRGHRGPMRPPSTLDGHGSCVGGAIVDSGNFDWMAHAGQVPRSDHAGRLLPRRVTYAKDFGKGAFITKATAQLMRDLRLHPAAPIETPGSWACIWNRWPVRMQRHCENAQKVAEFLNDDPRVSWVQFPGLPGDKYYETAPKVHAERHLRRDLLRRARRPRTRSPRCSTTSR